VALRIRTTSFQTDHAKQTASTFAIAEARQRLPLGQRSGALLG